MSLTPKTDIETTKDVQIGFKIVPVSDDISLHRQVMQKSLLNMQEILGAYTVLQFGVTN